MTRSLSSSALPILCLFFSVWQGVKSPPINKPRSSAATTRPLHPPRTMRKMRPIKRQMLRRRPLRPSRLLFLEARRLKSCSISR